MLAMVSISLNALPQAPGSAPVPRTPRMGSRVPLPQKLLVRRPRARLAPPLEERVVIGAVERRGRDAY